MEEQAKFGDIFDLTFTKYVTPMVIRIIYILVMVLAAIAWLVAIIGATNANGFLGFLAGLVFGGLGFLVMLLLYRVMLELVMVIFAIKENTDRLG
ncbi:MAG: DUF4282 domain-containing protein [Actinomycetota bacterium]